MHLTIRADGGPNIGYGHLIRTGALAEHALDNGNRITYATRTPEHAREVCPGGIDIVALDADRPHDAFFEWLAEARPDAVLTDSYEVHTGRQRAIAERVPRHALVLDDTRFAICADVLINGNVYAPDLNYEWIGSKPEMCLGTEYLLLRREIRDLAAERPPFRETPERALITMGGGDIRGTTPQIVRAFDRTDLHVDVIVGPGFKNHGEIEKAVAETEGDLEVRQDPDDLPERMFIADLAVSATGSTVYELLALGTPTIGLPQAKNQTPIVNALAERDAIVTLNGNEDVLPERIRNLAGAPNLRKTLRDYGMELVDGQGVKQVYSTVVEGL